MFTEQISNLLDLCIDGLLAFAMHHGKQVVQPFGWMPWAMVAMADKVQLPNFLSQFVDEFIGNVPHRHAVKAIAQFVMVGHGADTANDAVVLHGC